jgi:hypothetical protein
LNTFGYGDRMCEYLNQEVLFNGHDISLKKGGKAR